jgi:cytochrome c oxidase subunit IV
MRVLFLKNHNGVSRVLRYALLALTLVIVVGYGVRVTMTAVLNRLPSLVEMISVALLLGLLVVVAVRWHDNRRMRRATVDLQDSALW